MNKKKIIEKFIELLSADLENARQAAEITKEAATNEESQPENQYDTRALEASYLAGAQAHRVREVEAQLTMLKQADVKTYNDDSVIGPTALVQIQSGQQQSYILLMPHGGGLNITYENHSILIVTPGSPLGEAVVGLQVGETAVVENSKLTKKYVITSVQ